MQQPLPQGAFAEDDRLPRLYLQKPQQSLVQPDSARFRHVADGNIQTILPKLELTPEGIAVADGLDGCQLEGTGPLQHTGKFLCAGSINLAGLDKTLDIARYRARTADDQIGTNEASGLSGETLFHAGAEVPKGGRGRN